MKEKKSLKRNKKKFLLGIGVSSIILSTSLFAVGINGVSNFTKYPLNKNLTSISRGGTLPDKIALTDGIGTLLINSIDKGKILRSNKDFNKVLLANKDNIVDNNKTLNQLITNNIIAIDINTTNKINNNVLVKNKFIQVLFDDLNNNNQNLFQKANWSNGNPFYNAWCPQQINFNNSNLIITLNKTICHFKTHASGEYRTLKTYKYGRYSSSFIASDVNGTISSFFTYTGISEGTAWDEIDFEILGENTNKVQINYWRNGIEHPIYLNLGFDAALKMHKYSFIWNKEYIEWYVDDILIYKVTENHLNNKDSLPLNPGKIILNLWAGIGIDNWSGKYDSNSTAQISYDYVKYEKFI